MSRDPSAAGPTSTDTLQLAAIALAALRDARSTAADACLAYQMTLPPEQRPAARTDRIPVIVVGPPRAALERAVAMLATCDAAAGLALELSLAFDEAARIAALTAAVEATSRSARIGVRALRRRGSTELRLELAHAAAHATHQVADALGVGGVDRVPHSKVRRSESLHNRFPPAWRDVIACLGERLASQDLEEASPERAGAAAAHDAADRVMHVYEAFRMTGAADGALRRYARVAALASIYAGWSALENGQAPDVQPALQT
jgi:hypothetical protein